MTPRMKPARWPSLPAAALATLLLAGCSSGHVGEDWQCPLAAGGSCASVAAADPAVPKPAAVQRRAPGEPIRLLPREDAAVSDKTSMGSRSCGTDCGFDPFAWLARLFGESSEADDSEQPTEPEPVALPAETSEAEAPPAGTGDGQNPADDDLRTGERVARIWIAPFVDADGIYREASHVRVVLEPAGWRLP